MKSDTPSALMSGAMRGARRSGRYANRSIATPRNPQPTIAASNMRTIRIQTATLGSCAPPSQPRTPQPMNAPTMSTSPCARLSSFRIPYTIENPSATSA
jgi:hypothetical protein